MPAAPPPSPPFWTVLAEFPLFVLRVFVNPRSVVRSLDWEKPATLQRLALYALIWLGILVWAFSDNRLLAEEPRPALSTFKGVAMRAHDRSWDGSREGWQWLRLHSAYRVVNLNIDAAKRLWDTLLTSGFLALTFFLGLLATAIVARLRMWRFGLAWDYALGTGLLAYLTAVTLLAVSLAPLGLLLICRNCTIRLVLYVLLNIGAWAYFGYFTLADLGVRPVGALALLGKSIAWGLGQFVLAYVLFLLLLLAVFPLV